MPSAHRRRLGASAVDWLREVAVVTAKTRICDDWLIGIRGTGQPMSLFEELRRRNVIRMVGLYVVGAWLITQVATRGGVHP